MQFWPLSQEDLLEEEIATHSSMFAWKIPWTEEPGGYSPCDHRVGHNWACTHKVNKTWTALLSLCYSFWYLHACILVSLEEKWGRESNICCVFATCQTLYLLMILFSVHSILFRVSLVAWLVKNLPVMRDTWVRSLGGEDPWRRKWQPTLVFLRGKSNGQRSLGATVHGIKKSQTHLSD